jgi:hypothetical protein
MGDTHDAVFGQDGNSDPALKPRVDTAHSLLFGLLARQNTFIDWVAIAMVDCQCHCFGLLARQNNFIDRETLLAAFNAWVADKSRSLGTILLDKGALTPARHAVLQTLVREHLRQHDFDLQRSLIAITVPPSAREPSCSSSPRPGRSGVCAGRALDSAVRPAIGARPVGPPTTRRPGPCSLLQYRGRRCP